MSLRVIQPGILSLLQDSGRHGQHRLGLSNGGPMDTEAFNYCNRLLNNLASSTVIEVSVGGLQLQAETDTFICITGAATPLTINGEEASLWQVHPISTGDTVKLGFASCGCRTYLGVAGGFTIEPSFGSTATVTREGIGGLNGSKLQAGDLLPCPTATTRKRLYLAEQHRPRYHRTLTVRVIPGYQQTAFSREQQRRFFGSTYTVSEQCDRMGYRLEGPAITCAVSTFLSEGICFGAIQVPPDGQPIVLLNDRQTIGGYPKIGTALSLDAARLTQLVPGSTVHFAAITVGTAQRALHLAQRFADFNPLLECRT